MKKYLLPLLLLLLLLWAACADAPPPPDEETIASATTAAAMLPTVQITTATRRAFPLRLRANGTIEARRQAVIKAAAGGELVTLAEEGDALQKGQVLAKIDATEWQLQQAELQQQLAEAALKRDELMVRYAGEVGVDTSVNPVQMAVILSQSGYTKTERALDRIQFQIKQATIAAPFAGRVADRKVQLHERISAGTEICTLIDPASLEIEFKLLEQEIAHVQTGQAVHVQPVGLPETTIAARVTIINPQVDENGLVRVRAQLQNYGRYRLYTGMTALVSLERSAGTYLTVPKAAVVDRSGRAVVFVYDADSQVAKWKYVTVAHENDTDAAISDGLTEGDQVIYSGNLNLDHDSQVQLATENDN